LAVFGDRASAPRRIGDVARIARRGEGGDARAFRLRGEAGCAGGGELGPRAGVAARAAQDAVAQAAVDEEALLHLVESALLRPDLDLARQRAQLLGDVERGR